MGNPLQRDEFRQHCRLVDAIAAAGAPPPDEWVRLRGALQSFTELGTPMLSRLTAAIIDGPADADIPALRAAAHAEQVGLEAGSKVNSRVRTAVLARMREVYAATATDNYGRVAAVFDDWAGKLTATAAQVDVQATGEAMVDQPDKIRRAWLDAQHYAHRLDKLTPALVAAAQLAGVAVRDDGSRLALTADPHECHRRRVWESWHDTSGRCSHWAPLLRLGCSIRAAELAGFQPYREPAPMQQRTKPAYDGLHSYELVSFDPDPTWLKLVHTTAADHGERVAEVVGYGVCGGEYLAAGFDVDGVVAAGGADEFLYAPPGVVFDPVAYGQRGERRTRCSGGPRWTHAFLGEPGFAESVTGIGLEVQGAHVEQDQRRRPRSGVACARGGQRVPPPGLGIDRQATLEGGVGGRLDSDFVQHPARFDLAGRLDDPRQH